MIFNFIIYESVSYLVPQFYAHTACLPNLRRTFHLNPRLSSFPEHTWQSQIEFFEWWTPFLWACNIHLQEIREKGLGVLLHSYVSPAPRSPWSLQTSGINLPFNSLFQQLGPSLHTLWKDQLPPHLRHGQIFWGCIYSHWLLSPWWVMSTAFSICPSWTLTAPSNKIAALLQVPRKQLTLECETTS